MISPLDRWSFFTRQGLRVAWYMGHYFAAQDFRQAGREPRSRIRTSLRRRGRIHSICSASSAALFRRDLDNVAQGLYPLPRDHDGSLAEVLSLSRAFFADVPLAAERKNAGAGREIYDPGLAREFPDYFLQNFHYQTGGYLTEESARLYDTQVEVLFSGTANAMRRQCIVPVAQFLRGRDQRDFSLLDVACGTGRFLRFLKEAFPAWRLRNSTSRSPISMRRAAIWPPMPRFWRSARPKRFPSRRRASISSLRFIFFTRFPVKCAGRLPLNSSACSSPAGVLIFMDSLQLGDRTGFDGLLEAFPRNFHEPYFGDYLRDDLRAVFSQVGLRPTSVETFFLSKRIVCEKLT